MGTMLAGKTAIITGAGFGIGAAIAREFLCDGANVVITDLRHVELRGIADNLRVEFGNHITAIPGDIRDSTLQALLLETCRLQFGGVDIIVNNAANQTTLPIAEATPEHWNAVRSVNVDAAFRLIQTALPELAPGSAIINISSLLGEMAMSGRIAYETSKTALLGLTRALAVELGPRNIRVNAILPGHIMSVGEEQWKLRHDERTQRIFPTSYPLQRVGKPEEIGRVAVFLASDNASFITGQSIRVDGGMSIMCPEEAVFRAAEVMDQYRKEQGV